MYSISFPKTYYINNTLSFSGATKKVGSKAHNNMSVLEDDLKTHKDKSQVVGKIPPAWFEQIPENKRKEIPEFLKEMGNALKNIDKKNVTNEEVLPVL